VRRDVLRLVTPGTLTEDRLLEPGRPNRLVAVARRRASEGAWCYGIASVDISTGHFAVSEADELGLAAEIARLDPREIVLPDTIHDDPDLAGLWRGNRPLSPPSPATGSIRPRRRGG
jgi:DNA mismatch repair protein MutS